MTRIKKQSPLTITGMHGLSGSMLFYVDSLSSSACYQCNTIDDLRGMFFMINDDFGGDVDVSKLFAIIHKIYRGEYAI